MDLKKEVRRRIEELTRLAYERGYRDGAQSALAEIEKVAGEDLAEQLKGTPASLQVLAKTGAADVRRRPAVKKQKAQQRKTKPNGGAPKAVTVAGAFKSSSRPRVKLGVTKSWLQRGTRTPGSQARMCSTAFAG
jgi:hypothetical protein